MLDNTMCKYYIRADPVGDLEVHYHIPALHYDIEPMSWDEVKLNMQIHYVEHGSPLDVLEWDTMTEEEYFSVE